jgi:hypothetical protein
MLDNYHKIYRFDNGYGASVVSGPNTYGGKNGLFEVAVLDNNGEITYNTSVAGDVVGWLDFDGVVDILNKIKSL